MKKLFLKNGAYEFVRTHTDQDGTYLAVYQDEKLVYTIFKGNSATRQTVIFPDGFTEISQWQILIMAEIIENFQQYFNQLQQ